MQSQDGPPRALRNVPAFRDLRTGSPASGRAGSNPAQPIGESCRDVYELTAVDPVGTRSDPTATPPRQPSPYLDSRPESRLTPDEEDEGETPIDTPNIAPPQRSPDNSEKTITDQAFSRSAIWKEIRLPLLWIHGSMLLILALLAVLVSVYKVKPVKGLFFEPTGWSYSKQRAYILLNIPASMIPHRYGACR